MSFTNLRKETSERSDASNWAKKALIENTHYYSDSIEGCNENSSDTVTMLMERARVDGDERNETTDMTFRKIKSLEGDCLIRKINFSLRFGLNLSYFLYNDELEKVWMYEISSLSECKFIRKFESYKEFSEWIQKKKGWKSNKSYREKQDLPFFDRALRRYGCAWPTNIDCFISDLNNNSVGILEFQNAKKTKVKEHCNNKHFLCEIKTIRDGNVYFSDDIRRWLSQEILRVQSGLRLFVITWSQNEPDFILKEIESIAFPEYPGHTSYEMKNVLHEFTISPVDSYVHKERWRFILNNFKSYKLIFKGQMEKEWNNPPLERTPHSAPRLYYRYKSFVPGDPNKLPVMFTKLLNNQL